MVVESELECRSCVWLTCCCALAQQPWISQRKLPDRPVTLFNVCVRLSIEGWGEPSSCHLQRLPKWGEGSLGCPSCSSYCQKGGKEMLMVGMVMAAVNKHLLPTSSSCATHSHSFFLELFYSLPGACGRTRSESLLEIAFNWESVWTGVCRHV